MDKPSPRNPVNLGGFALKLGDQPSAICIGIDQKPNLTVDQRLLSEVCRPEQGEGSVLRKGCVQLYVQFRNENDVRSAGLTKAADRLLMPFVYRWTCNNISRSPIVTQPLQELGESET